MRALVTYSSQSGNTRMLAQEVFESLNCEKVLPEGPSVDPIASTAIRRYCCWNKGIPMPIEILLPLPISAAACRALRS